MTHTSSEDWNLFQAEFNEWQKRLSLGDWEVEHAERKMASARAKAEWTLEAMAAKVTFSSDWTGAILNPYEITRTAFHECLELLLAELSGMAMSKFNHDEVSRVTHAVIHRIEAAFFKPITLTQVQPSGIPATQA